MKVGGQMAKQIKDLSGQFHPWVDNVERGLMLRYINEDWNYDVNYEIDQMLEDIKDARNSKDYEYTINALKYFKYLYAEAKGDKQEAYAHLKRAFKEGSLDAIAQYAYFYYKGEGLSSSAKIKKANKLFEVALSRKSMFASYLYAEALFEGDETDIETARKIVPYYEEALNNGVVLARYNLACCYILTRQKLGEAQKLLEKCDEPEAKYKLAQVRTIRTTNKKK